MTDRERDPDWPLGSLLKRRREELGFSRREAASAAGVSTRIWNAIEDGRTPQRPNAPQQPYDRTRGPRPTVDVVVRVAGGVRIEPSSALYMAGYDPAVYGVKIPLAARPAQTDAERSAKIARLSVEQRALVDWIVDEFLRGGQQPARITVAEGRPRSDQTVIYERPVDGSEGRDRGESRPSGGE